MSEDWDRSVDSLTDASFESTVLEANKPMIVYFRADWCGPCVAIDPVVERLTDAHADAVDVAKIDVDDNPRVAGYYGFKALPTFIRLEDGAVVDRRVGAVPEPELRTLFEPA